MQSIRWRERLLASNKSSIQCTLEVKTLQQQWSYKPNSEPNEKRKLKFKNKNIKRQTIYLFFSGECDFYHIGNDISVGLFQFLILWHTYTHKHKSFSHTVFVYVCARKSMYFILNERNNAFNWYRCIAYSATDCFTLWITSTHTHKHPSFRW